MNFEYNYHPNITLAVSQDREGGSKHILIASVTPYMTYQPIHLFSHMTSYHPSPESNQMGLTVKDLQRHASQEGINTRI